MHRIWTPRVIAITEKNTPKSSERRTATLHEMRTLRQTAQKKGHDKPFRRLIMTSILMTQLRFPARGGWVV